MISLTLKSGGAFKILKDNVYRFCDSASGSGSTVFYFTPFSSEEKQAMVNESTSDINTDAGTFFVEATTVSGVQYLNPYYIVLVSQNGSGADIVFGKEQDKPIQLTVTESVATITTAIDSGTSGGGAEIYKTALLRITGGGSGITELYNDTGDTFSISASGDIFYIESTTPFTGDEKISYNNIFLSGPTPGDMFFVGCSLVTYISGKRIQLSPAIFFGSPAEGPSLVPAIPDSTIEIKILA